MAGRQMDPAMSLGAALLCLMFVIGGGDALSRGQGDESYYFAVLSDMHIGAGETERALAVSAVEKINELAAELDVRFVFITGDISNSALDEQFEDARSILDELEPFYLPIIGNHDMWGYNGTTRWEEPRPTGDARFARAFAKQFQRVGVVYNNESTYNPDEDITSWFQNFEFSYGKNVFYGLDWNSRHHAVSKLGYLGAMPGARLHDYEGGTFQWLQQRLARLPTDLPPRSVITLQHHPFRLPLVVPDFVYSFGHEEQAHVRDLFMKQPEQYWGLIAGHMHIWYNNTAWPRTWPAFWQWQTAACKKCAAISLVRVENSTISHIEKVYGSTARCLFDRDELYSDLMGL